VSTPQQPPAPTGDTAGHATPGQATPEQAATAIRKARGAMSRYRFMAILTGVMLLILCVELFFKYVVPVEVVVDYMGWVPFAHGWIYVVYLVTVLDLWAKMRWGFGRLTTMVFAGVVPVMSFVLEKRVHADADAKLAALADRYGVG
jgi:integral membrane protein